MIDGKTLNAELGNNSSRNCPICLAGPAKLKGFDRQHFQPTDEQTLLHGLCPLHVLLRGFDYFLNVGSHRQFMQHEARGAVNQSKRDETKKEMREEARRVFGVHLWEARIGGAGNRHDKHIIYIFIFFLYS